jgi:hypothetical protein
VRAKIDTTRLAFDVTVEAAPKNSSPEAVVVEETACTAELAFTIPMLKEVVVVVPAEVAWEFDAKVTMVVAATVSLPTEGWKPSVSVTGQTVIVMAMTSVVR